LRSRANEGEDEALVLAESEGTVVGKHEEKKTALVRVIFSTLFIQILVRTGPHLIPVPVYSPPYLVFSFNMKMEAAASRCW
jgi:hypothetical protein